MGCIHLSLDDRATKTTPCGINHRAQNQAVHCRDPRQTALDREPGLTWTTDILGGFDRAPGALIFQPLSAARSSLLVDE